MTTQGRILETAPRAVTSAQERNSRLERILKNVVSLRGVTAAVIVDADGLVTHAHRDFDLSTDALGAAVQVAFSSAQRSSEHVLHGHTHLVVVEGKEGFVILGPLNKGFLLALVADMTALLGAVRYEVKQTIHVLNEALG